MQIKYTKAFLTKLEDIFAESDYQLRYEKGNFKSGFCLLKDHKVAVVNKYYPLEGRINALVEIIRELKPDPEKLREPSRKLVAELTQTEIKF
jgi:hypothetical protein